MSEEKPDRVTALSASIVLLLFAIAALSFGRTLIRGRQLPLDLDVPPGCGPIAAWTETESPLVSDRATESWLTSCSWHVSPGKPRPVVSLAVDRWAPSHVLPFALPEATWEEGLQGFRGALRVDDGWLVAFNAGEWGGAVWWFSPDGKERRLLVHANPMGFVETGGSILVPVGSCHGHSSRGSVLRIQRGQDGAWASDTIADLPTCPRVAAEERPGSVLVLAGEELLRVDLGGRVTPLHKLGNGRGVSSIAVGSGGEVFLGGQEGVVRLVPSLHRFSETLLVPPGCVTAHYPVEGERCSCDTR